MIDSKSQSQAALLEERSRRLISERLAIASFIIRYRDEGATPGEYETAASEHVGDSRKRLVVTLVNARRLPSTNRGKRA